MDQSFQHAITVFMAFFAIMNPIANTAAFAGLTSEMEQSEKRETAAKALIITFTIIVLFAMLGKTIFNLFGISLPALRIAGGILVFIVGYQMLHGTGSKLHAAHEVHDTDVAVSPMAVPLLAGPGTIATAMNYSAAGGWMEIFITILVFSILCLITFFCFIFSSKIIHVIGQNGLSITTRLMGLILTVIGVQMFLLGLKVAIQMDIPL
jgi:multiple antibiotic resistance protein